MSPSLNEIYDKRVPLETRDELDDVEDMTYALLILNASWRNGLHSGKIVKIVYVDPVDLGNTHKYKLLDGAGVIFITDNNDDIYEEEKL